MSGREYLITVTVKFWSSQQHCFSLFKALGLEKSALDEQGLGKKGPLPSLLFPLRTRSTRGIGPLWILTRSSPLSTRRRIPVGVSGNFQRRMEQHLPEFPEKMTTLRDHRNVWKFLTGNFCFICLSTRNFRNIWLNVSLLWISTISVLTGNISWKLPFRWKASYVPCAACSLMEFHVYFHTKYTICI